MVAKLKILLVGCGKMGGALLNGFIAEGVDPKNVTVVDPYANLHELKKLKVNYVSGKVEDKFNFCIIAVKPKDFDNTLKKYKHLKKACFISIAAGKTVDKMTGILGADAAIVRAMPNLPATINKGLTGLYLNKNVSKVRQDQVFKLFSSVGGVLHVKKEPKIDIITAISGSGPAYVFHIIEIIAKIGEELGLSPENALVVSKSTVFGSAGLAMISPRTPTELRTDVTSPGGTTEAALKVLMGDNKLENLFRDAIKAAIKRAKELQ